MITAININTKEEIEVIPCKEYALNVHANAVYQYTHAYNNHIALLISNNDYNANDTVYRVGDRYYTLLFTNQESYFKDKYEDLQSSAMINEQLSLF
jgi:hypothetical protein